MTERTTRTASDIFRLAFEFIDNDGNNDRQMARFNKAIAAVPASDAALVIGELAIALAGEALESNTRSRVLRGFEG